MFLFLILINYSLGLYILCKNRNYILFFYIYWIVFARYIVSFFVLDPNLVLYFSGQANYFLLLAFLLDAAIRKKIAISVKATRYVMLLFILLLFCSLFNSAPLLRYLMWALSSIIPVYCIAYFANSICVKSRILLIIGLIAFAVEICIGFVQISSTHLLVSPYTVLSRPLERNIMFFSGTLLAANAMASFILITFVVLFYLLKFAAFKHKMLAIIISLFAFIGILLTGIRTYLALFIVTFPILLLVKSKYNTFTITVIALSILSASSFFSLSSNGITRNTDNPVERQIYGFSQAKDGYIEESTIGCSMYIITKYFNPIHVFGEGKLYTRNGYNMIVLPEFGNTSWSVTDATLAVYIVEFGWPYILIYVLFLFHVTKISIPITSCKKLLFHKILFTVVLLATITDAGLFQPLNIAIMSLFSAAND